MRYVRVPAPATLPGGEADYPFTNFLDEFVWDKLRRKSFDLFDSASEKMESAKAGDVVAWTDEEHEAATAILQETTLHGLVARRLKPFFKALKGAALTAPAPVEMPK